MILASAAVILPSLFISAAVRIELSVTISSLAAILSASLASEADILLSPFMSPEI